MMSVAGARRAATTVGLVTFPIGGALVFAPQVVARALSLRQLLPLRIIGVADLALVPGLIAGRPRWPWMASRAVLNVAIAAYLLDESRRSSDLRSRFVALVLGAVTVADGATIRRLLDAERR